MLLPTLLCGARAPLVVNVLFDPKMGIVLLWLLFEDDEDPDGTGIGGRLTTLFDVVEEARSGATTEDGTGTFCSW